MSNDKSNALDRYQEATQRTANDNPEAIIKRLQLYPELVELTNYAMGAAGEAGEICDLVKKIVFHGHPLDQNAVEQLIKECGDELWYLARASAVLKVKLSKVAATNIEKLKKRYPDGFNENNSINRKG